ncbi:MAG: hypothetical protein WAU86_00465 [Oricola sp.]
MHLLDEFVVGQFGQDDFIVGHVLLHPKGWRGLPGAVVSQDSELEIIKKALQMRRRQMLSRRADCRASVSGWRELKRLHRLPGSLSMPKGRAETLPAHSTFKVEPCQIRRWKWI